MGNDDKLKRDSFQKEVFFLAIFSIDNDVWNDRGRVRVLLLSNSSIGVWTVSDIEPLSGVVSIYG